MTSLASTPTTDIQPIKPSTLSVKLAMTLALAGFADWLFYEQRIGLSLTLFVIATAGASLLANHATLDWRRAVTGGAVLGLGLVPAVEELNTLSALILIAALTIALLLTTNPETIGLADRARALRNLFLFGPFRCFPEALQIFNMSAFTRGVALWLLPATLGTVFVALFAAANPVIEQWVSLLNPKIILEYVSIPRVLFWTMMLALVWPFIHVRWRRRTIAAPAVADHFEPAPLPPLVSAEFLGPSTVLRALILFNLLFAAQSILDGLYLWGHVALPANMTYAAYAHRGAYPLIATALLAAAFVLVAMRPGGPAETSRVIRPLVYLWVGQNILLVASSILRLDLYVDLYLLTYWRIAAFIWMGLVALGLVLIVARIALNRSNLWLVCANLITLAVVLYGAAFLNFDAVIADYNVTHSRETSGTGLTADINYLLTLGPQAIPAIDRMIELQTDEPRRHLVWRRSDLVEQLRRDMAWRTWSFRSWRLQRRLTPRQKARISVRTAQAEKTLAHRILIVDDEGHIREVIRVALRKAGMDVIEARDGKEALSRFVADKPDLIVLDIGMPEFDGLDVCREVRKSSDVPILFLSARDEEIDRVLGLEIGGDDYVTKPFSPRELVARVNVILRRLGPRNGEAHAGATSLSQGGLLIDPEQHAASFAGTPLKLTAIEFDILRALLTRPTSVFNREQLMRAAYQLNIHVSDRTIDSHIRNIRAKLAAQNCDNAIETIHGVGFKLGRCEKEA